MGGLGPMAGQAVHFRRYAPRQIAYAIARYTDEVNRLYGVMNSRLAHHEFLAGRYSIADMACVGWVRLAERQGQDLAQFPHVQRWFATVRARESVKRAFAIQCGPFYSATARGDAVWLLLDQFARVQVCDLQRTLRTQPLRSAVFGPVSVNEPLYVLPSSAL